MKKRFSHTILSLVARLLLLAGIALLSGCKTEGDSATDTASAPSVGSYQARVASPVTITLPADSMPENALVTWNLSSRPAGSALTLSGSGLTIAFTPDQDGVYVISVVITVLDKVFYRHITVEAGNYSKILRLGFTPVATAYSQSQEQLLLISKETARLYVYSVTAGTLSSINLPFKGVAIAVSEDGLRAVVAHDGSMSLIDLPTQTVANTVVTNNNYTGVVLSNAGVAVGAPGYLNSFVFLDTVDLVNGTVSTNENLTSPLNREVFEDGLLAQAGGRVYYATQGVSPMDISRIGFEGGIAGEAYDSQYHGDYDMCGKIWMYEDGSRILTGCRTVFSTGDTEASDIVYASTISDIEDVFNGWGIHSFSHSAEAGKFLVLQSDYWDFFSIGESYVQIHNATTMLKEASIDLPRIGINGHSYRTRGKWVHFTGDGSNHVVVIKADDGNSDEENALTNPYAIAVYN